jgi:hypothetical protein
MPNASHAVAGSANHATGDHATGHTGWRRWLLSTNHKGIGHPLPDLLHHRGPQRQRPVKADAHGAPATRPTVLPGPRSLQHRDHRARASIGAHISYAATLLFVVVVIRTLLAGRRVTVLFAAKDPAHNHALALKQMLAARRRAPAGSRDGG